MKEQKKHMEIDRESKKEVKGEEDRDRMSERDKQKEIERKTKWIENCEQVKKE